MTIRRTLTFDEIKEVFDTWRDQAMSAGEKTAELWNALLVDLREKTEEGISDGKHEEV